MSATYAQEQAALEGRFQTNWTTTVIQWPNIPFIQPSTPWVAMTILNGQGGRGDISENNPLRILPGVIMIEIFVPENTDTKLAMSYADTIAGLWRDEIISVGAAGKIHCGEPHVQKLGLQAGWFKVMVQVPYRREDYG